MVYSFIVQDSGIKYDGLEPYMFPGNHECPEDWCDNLINRARPFWGEELNNVYSPVALAYLATHDPVYAVNFLCQMSEDLSFKVFVGNEYINDELLNLLFGKVVRINTPAKNAYDKINEIHLTAKPVISRDYTLIITAMGCSGRVLQKRLWYEYDNVFLFDFGSLMDALCGWNTRAWIELTKFNHIEFLNKLKWQTYH